MSQFEEEKELDTEGLGDGTKLPTNEGGTKKD